MLTNFLPNRGNGTFRCTPTRTTPKATARCSAARTITCANSDRDAPFGAIDTPGQGETVSGTVYINFGWVLARGRRWRIRRSGTVTVFIDGVAVGLPAGWVGRSGSHGAVPGRRRIRASRTRSAWRRLDTTTLTNGVHTIAWFVTANNGQAAGIGSRYFTVQNASGAGRVAGARLPSADIDAAPLRIDRRDRRAARLRPRCAVPQSSGRRDGRHDVHGEELDRFEIALGTASSGSTLTGYLRTGDGLRAAAGRIASRRGHRACSPGSRASDSSTLRPRVRAAAGGRAISRQEVRIVISPKGSNASGPQVTIDVPVGRRGRRRDRRSCSPAGRSTRTPTPAPAWTHPRVGVSGRRRRLRSSSAPRRTAGGVRTSRRSSATSSATAATACSSRPAAGDLRSRGVRLEQRGGDFAPQARARHVRVTRRGRCAPIYF